MSQGNSDRADVVLSGYSNVCVPTEARTVRIVRRVDINRAIHGDIVVVQVC